jgi:hypothetical protein
MNSTKFNGCIQTQRKKEKKNVNYHIIIHVSMTGDLVVVIITCIILGLVIFTKRLHTATYLLFDL